MAKIDPNNPAPYNRPIKGLIMGDSGSGKTGALVSLLAAGYNVRIIDLDNGVDALIDIALKVCPDKLANLDFITCTDKLKITPDGMSVPVGVPKAFTKAVGLIQKFQDLPDTDLGPVEKWTSRDVLVVDSLTFLSRACMRYELALNGRSGQKPYPGDYGNAQNRIIGILDILYSTEIPCHVLINSHLTFIDPTKGAGITTDISDDSNSIPEKSNPYQKKENPNEVRAYPTVIGQALSPQVGRWFNMIIAADMVNTKRVILTSSTPLMELKVPRPTKIPPKLPIETGLAKIFECIYDGVAWDRDLNQEAQESQNSPASSAETDPLFPAA